FELDATANFCDDYYTRPDLLDRGTGHPTGNVGIGAAAFANLRDDVRVEHEFYRSTCANLHWRGWSKTPANASSGSSDPNTSKAVLVSGWINAFASTERIAVAFCGLARSVSPALG